MVTVLVAAWDRAGRGWNGVSISSGTLVHRVSAPAAAVLADGLGFWLSASGQLAARPPGALVCGGGGWRGCARHVPRARWLWEVPTGWRRPCPRGGLGPGAGG